MILIDFLKRFPDEQACKSYLRVKRQEEGITCKCCGNQKHYWFEAQQLWKCSECGSRTNLKAGTIMEKSKLPIIYWFITIHLMTSVKKSFSALELQKQLGHKRYEPIWYMMNKIRITMGKRDEKYKLEGELEIDDAFYEVVTIHGENNIKKVGRGSQKQLKVIVMVESTPNPHNQNKHRPSKSLGYVKMVVVDELTQVSINYEVKKAVDKNAVVLTDGWRGYNRIKQVIKEHRPMIVPAKEAGKKLPWVHMIISNSKRLLLGVHHSIGKEYLQNYLNEFCYKLNRRYMNDNLFDRMLTIGANDVWY